MSTPNEPTKPITSATNAVPAELELRVTGQKQTMMTRLAMLKSEGKPETVVERDAIKAKLSLIDHIVKEGVVDGWASISPATRTRIESWLA